MSMLKIEAKKYDDGLTKQAFKDSCDINKILKKAQKTGSIAHLQKYPELVYGEFDGVDLLGAYRRINRAQEIFDELPSEVRKEFDQDAFKFVAFASDPQNNDKLARILPAIAEPGAYFPNPRQRGGTGAGAATAPESVASADSPPADMSASADSGAAASADSGASKDA